MSDSGKQIETKDEEEKQELEDEEKNTAKEEEPKEPVKEEVKQPVPISPEKEPETPATAESPPAKKEEKPEVDLDPKEPKKSADEREKDEKDSKQKPPENKEEEETEKVEINWVDDAKKYDEDLVAEQKWAKVEEEARQKKLAEAEAAEMKKELEAKEKAEKEMLLHPRRAPFQSFVNMVSCFAVLASLTMATGQILGPALYKVTAVQWILRGYVVILCLMMIFVEFQWTKYSRDSAILRLWIPRGMFYIFLGVLGLEENEKSTFRDLERDGLTLVQTFVTAAAWTIIGLGFGYIILGATCMQHSYNELCEDYQKRKQVAWDIRHHKEDKKKSSAAKDSTPTGDDAV